MSVRLTWAISVALTALLAACNNNPRPAASSVSASTVLGELHLSTQVPPPLVAPSRVVVAASLSEPIILKGVPPVTFGGRLALQEPGTIALNFDKASLRTVIDAVLGDALGLPYTVDERVDGVVTMVSPQKLNREQALEALDGILRLNGATLIKGDTLYRVVLAANARQALPGPKLGAKDPGYAISVYVANHTSAAALQKLIEPLYQMAGAVAADPEHNLLLVTGGAEERRALIDAARLFDQDWLANQSVGIYPLHHARPKTMVEELRSLYGQGGAAAAEGSIVRFSAVERLNAVMVVSRQASGLDGAGAWIARLDQVGAGERSLHVYQVHYAKVATVAKLLSRLFTNTGAVEAGNAALPSGTVGTKITTQAATVTPAAPSGAAPTSSAGFASSDKALSEPETETLDAGDSGNGPKIIPDPASHALLVMANQAEARTIETALAQLDAKPAQILIEATIVEVTLNKNLQFGVQYFLRGTKLLEQDSSVGFNAGSTAGTISGIAPGFNGVLGTIGNPSVIISALDQVTDSKVLSSPQLLVTDSKEALLKVGTQTPLLTQQAVSTLTSSPPIVSSVEYHDTGVILRVLPHANEAGMVSLDIAQEVSDVVPSATNPLTPNIEQRRIESSVTVQSGQTVLLGGLIAENNSVGRNGLPLLSDLPLLGPLFGQQSDNRNRTELIIFITPHVLHDNDDAKALTDELLGRLTSMRPAVP